MNLRMNKSNVIFLWFFAILMVAVHPGESKETSKEVEETEEVRLYFQDGRHVKQKPKSSADRSSYPQHFSISEYSFDAILPQKSTKYILHCSLIFYH